MNRFIPGTTIKYTQQARDKAFTAVIKPVIDMTGGLTLSQLSKLTGLEGSTIQNWIKRGWISPTRSKKYSEQQVLRVLIINMLRGAMKLDDIAKLMHIINGDVEDTSDDIVKEESLYDMMCEIIFIAEENRNYGHDAVDRLVGEEMIKHKDDIHSDEDKLHMAMLTMLMAYGSSRVKAEMEISLGHFFEKYGA